MTLAAHQSDDATLLRRYAEQQADEAFAELVRRHISLVHSAALRLVGGDAASAADVTQAVFTELARHADRLGRHPALTGWLYTTTHRMAARHVRGEVRRQRRESEALVMQELLQEPAAELPLDWAQLRPVLDAAMHDLGETDRLAVLLRHFEQRPLAEISVRLGLSENAARMRVDRALDKLHAKLAKRGVTSTASALALALAGPAVTAAPTALAATITTAALAAAVTTTSTLGISTLMAASKLKLAAGALLVVLAGTAIVRQNRSLEQQAVENAALRQQVAQLKEDARQANDRAAQELSRLRQPSPELLRLRGEVAQLQKQVANARRSVAASGGQSASAQPAPEAEGAIPRDFGIRRMTESKLLVLGFLLFASDHHEQFPDSLETALALVKTNQNFSDQAAVLSALQTEDFELLYSGSVLAIANPSSAIVLRERAAWQNPQGGWMRTYAFADGHSEVHRSDDGDFSAWEAQHQVQPKTRAQPGSGGN
ncbi:MAG TPA: sigma-70 family RNA polymerase sigma factor [Candidatus Limnocylindria bacterium]|jgi:RNA polymerase sigma factor (sigma-70 family)|nr:sigma-70 family RNA polymerase sigma factor [Candidatus Limnocylindria bacterium]